MEVDERLRKLNHRLENYYFEFKKNYNYSFFMNEKTFKDRSVAKALLSIEDQSYDYLFDFLNKEKYRYLYNTFSGSGRLINELVKKKTIDEFECIYNIDCSIEMINFERSFFSKYVNVDYICEDFVKGNIAFEENSIVICHCGLRYAIYRLQSLVNSIEKIVSKNVKCLVSETNKQVIEEFISEINVKQIPYNFIEKIVKVQRNTKLYVAYILYDHDIQFRNDILKLSELLNLDISAIMIDVAGYKETKQYIIEFN